MQADWSLLDACRLKCDACSIRHIASSMTLYAYDEPSNKQAPQQLTALLKVAYCRQRIACLAYRQGTSGENACS